MTQETKAGEPRLVSYCTEMQTCTLNLNGKEYYYNLRATAGKETKADEPVVWLFNGADGLWLNITCAGKHYSLNLSSDKMSHPVAVAIVNKFCNGKTGTGRIHVTDQETKAGEPVAYVRFCSDGGYEGPIMATDKRMVGARAMSWTPLYTAHQDTEALRQRVKELGTQVEDLIAMKLMLMASGEEYRAQLATQAEQIQHLQMALADTEALELGTSERCQRQAEQLKMAREGFNKLARLGNGDHLGGSTGNLIAQEYLSKLGEQ